MSAPRARGRPLLSRVHPRANADDSWQTYQPTLVRLQLDPEFQETFYEDIVYPYRQKNKILLKRGTPASFATLTRNLLRAYGQRVWGNRSHWLIGGARDGTERKVTRMSRDRAATQTQKSESGSAVNGEENGRGAEDREEATTPATAKATTTARIEEDGEDVEGAEQQGAAEREGEDLEDDGFGEEYWAARGYRGPLNEWGKPTYVNARNVMWTPDDIAIQDLVNDGEDAGEPNESTQEEQKEGSEAEDEIEMEDEAEVDVASLYFEVPKDKEKIERILDSLWIQMRENLFEERR